MRARTLAARAVLAPLACTLSLSVHPAVLGAQGTAADYARSESLRGRLDGLVVDLAESPVWAGAGNQFIYRKAVKGGHQFTFVDATTRERRVAFDHDRLAAALGSSLSRPGAPTLSGLALPFTTATPVDGGRAIEFTPALRAGAPTLGAGQGAAPERWRCTLADYACARVPAASRGDSALRWRRSIGGGFLGNVPVPDARARRSPDGTMEAMIRNSNVVVRPVAGGSVVALTADGSEGDAYEPGAIFWSPDSKRIAAYRVRPGYRRQVHYIESSPEDQLQPKHSSIAYNKPGDLLDLATPVVIDVAARSAITVDRTLFPNPYTIAGLEWRRDGRAFTFEYNQRGHQTFRVIEVDATTGRARTVIDETNKTFFGYSGKRFRRDLQDGRETIWMSERDGWNHLYLYDGATGKVKGQITKGPWVVRGVEWVDTVARQVYFTASGMYSGKDPYFVHAYRVNFDGTGLKALTEADGNHAITWSPDRAFYVDSWSRVDLPTVTELRRTSDASLVMALERGDNSALLATGWKPPEVFVSKARDGVTDIWGVIIRPTNFDPSKRYPVVENIYAGPHSSFVPKSWSTQLPMQSLAELGFIVVQIDGMGTANRSKAFHDVAWRNLKDAGFPDRILWHKAAAAKYPHYDATRVGIYGTSAGGQNSMGALLFHPEFYKAAVSAAGCHDNRMDKIWWNEQWMGELGAHYGESSNVDNAHRLQGKLLLVVGEMDQNVDPASTYQVVDALIDAGKMFDLLVIPGAGHTDGGAYGQRKRNDFFVRPLMGAEPPDRNVRRAAAGN